MAILNMSAASQALKLFYLPGLQYQLNTANPILSVIERDSQSVVGDEIRMALRYGRQGGIGMRADDGALPTPNSRKTKQAAWKTKNMFARIQISDKTMRASRSTQGAFVSLLEADLEDCMADAKDNLARQVFGDGTGKMATFAVNTAQTTLNVDNAQYFTEGMFIDICNAAGTVLQAGREITSADYDLNKITISGANVTTAATDIAVIAGNYGLEITGFGSIFTKDNTIYGIDRSQNKWFNPIVDAVGGTISEVRIQKNIDEVDRRAGAKTNFLCSSYGVRRAYQNLLVATKQIVNVMQLEGGWDALTYNHMPFTVDKYSPAQTIFGLDLSTIKKYQLMDFQWLDDDGAVLSRVSGFPVWEAVLAKYADLGCSKPAGNFKMTGITEA